MRLLVLGAALVVGGASPPGNVLAHVAEVTAIFPFARCLWSRRHLKLILTLLLRPRTPVSFLRARRQQPNSLSTTLRLRLALYVVVDSGAIFLLSS